MFDFGWAEMLLIVAIAVLVIGPHELPAIMRTVGQGLRRLQYVKFALSRQFDDFMREHDLNELRNDAHMRPHDPGHTPDMVEREDGRMEPLHPSPDINQDTPDDRSDK